MSKRLLALIAVLLLGATIGSGGASAPSRGNLAPPLATEVLLAVIASSLFGVAFFPPGGTGGCWHLGPGRAVAVFR